MEVQLEPWLKASVDMPCATSVPLASNACSCTKFIYVVPGVLRTLITETGAHAGLAVADALGEREGDGEPLTERDAATEGVATDDALRDAEMEGETLCEAATDCDSATDAPRLRVTERDAALDGETLAEGERDQEIDDDAEREALAEMDGVGDALQRRHWACMLRRFAVPLQGSPPKLAKADNTEQELLPRQRLVTRDLVAPALHAPGCRKPHVPVGVPKAAKSMFDMLEPGGHVSVP